MPHQRTGTKLLTDAERVAVHRLLMPARPDLQDQEWDGKNNESKRLELAGKLKGALLTATDTKYNEVVWKDSARKLPMTSLYAAGDAAKDVVDEALRPWTAQAALTDNQRALRAAFAFRCEADPPRLVDVSDYALRARVRQPVSAQDMTDYFIRHDPGCQQAREEHHFKPPARGTDTPEGRFLDEVIAAFAADNRPKLEICDRYGYAMANPGTGTVFTSSVVDGWKADQDETADVVVVRKWELFCTFVHEYIHILQHPFVPAATHESEVVREGVCEFLARQILRGLASRSDEDLSRLGDRIAGTARGHRTQAQFAGWQGDRRYNGHVAAVEQAAAATGENGVKAAFLQGHVEFLGLNQYGHDQPGAVEGPVPAPGELQSRSIPSPLPGPLAAPADLAAATGLRLNQIQVFDPQTVGLGRRGASVLLPGFRGHFVVFLRDQNEDLEQPPRFQETWAQIAEQNGTTADDLRRLNRLPQEPPPGGTWLITPLRD